MNDIEDILESFLNDSNRKKYMDLLADAFFDNLELNDHCEFGGWGLDDKRPFGNSNVEADLAEIIGWERDSIYKNENADLDEDKVRYLRELYYNLGPYLKYMWKSYE